MGKPGAVEARQDDYDRSPADRFGRSIRDTFQFRGLATASTVAVAGYLVVLAPTYIGGFSKPWNFVLFGIGWFCLDASILIAGRVLLTTWKGSPETDLAGRFLVGVSAVGALYVIAEGLTAVSTPAGRIAKVLTLLAALTAAWWLLSDAAAYVQAKSAAAPENNEQQGPEPTDEAQDTTGWLRRLAAIGDVMACR